jgi:hypothetical protein
MFDYTIQHFDAPSHLSFRWSFNYFFYNKKMKRVVFFHCRARRTNGEEPSELSQPTLNQKLNE